MQKYSRQSRTQQRRCHSVQASKGICSEGSQRQPMLCSQACSQAPAQACCALLVQCGATRLTTLEPRIDVASQSTSVLQRSPQPAQARCGRHCSTDIYLYVPCVLLAAHPHTGAMPLVQCKQLHWHWRRQWCQHVAQLCVVLHA